jgi:hypothetical protein
MKGILKMLLTDYFEKKTDKELRQELKELNNMIDKVDCFG